MPVDPLAEASYRLHSTATIIQHPLSLGHGYVLETFVEPSLSVVLPLRPDHLVCLVVLLKLPATFSLLAATFPEDEVF